MDGLQIHILHANYAQVHKQAPIKMAAGVVSMVFHLRAWFGSVYSVDPCVLKLNII